MVEHLDGGLTGPTECTVNQATALSTTTTAPVVTLVGDKAVVDSRDVAARFGKRHSDVLRSIDLLLSTAPACERNFASTSGVTPMPNGGGREERFFLIDRDGFALLAMGFTGSKAMSWKLSYIAAFNAMEAELRRRAAPDLDDNNVLRRLLLAKMDRVDELVAEVTETRQALVVTEKRAAFAEAVIEEVRPKIEGYEAFLDADGLCTISTAARAIDAPQKLFFAWLREKGYLFDADGFAQPRADLRKSGYMKIRWLDVAPKKREWRTYVTKPGLEWLRQRWYVGPGQALRLQAAVANRQAQLPGL